MKLVSSMMVFKAPFTVISSFLLAIGESQVKSENPNPHVTNTRSASCIKYNKKKVVEGEVERQTLVVKSCITGTLTTVLSVHPSLVIIS